ADQRDETLHLKTLVLTVAKQDDQRFPCDQKCFVGYFAPVLKMSGTASLMGSRVCKATRNSGSFELDGSTLRPLTNVGFPPGVLRDVDSFMRTSRAVSKEQRR